MNFQKGYTYKTNYRQLRIMAIEDGYIMCRYKSCIPFVKDHNSFIKLLEIMEATPLNHKP